MREMIATFFSQQMDYVYAVYGFAFALIAVNAFLIWQSKLCQTITWKWFFFFGVIHAINEWLDMVAIAFRVNPAFTYVQLFILVLSFVFLVEFARTSARKPLTSWIYIPLVFLAVWGGLKGMAGLNASVRYAFGLTGAIGSAWALWQDQKNKSVSSAGLKMVAIGLLLYGLATGLVPAPADFWPASFINTRVFFSCFGFPVQIVRMLLAFLIAIGLWIYREAVWLRELKQGLFGTSPQRFFAGVFMGMVAGVFLLGWFATEYFSTSYLKDKQWNLLEKASVSAAAVNITEVKSLNANETDLNNPDYQRLKEQLILMRRALLKGRFIYLMSLEADGVHFLVDSEPPDSKDYSPPGQLYKDATPALVNSFSLGEKFIEGPTTDEWGTWVSSLIPLKDPVSRRVVAVLGIDESASDWESDRLQNRFPTLLVVILLVCLFAGGLVTGEQFAFQNKIIFSSEQELRMIFDHSSAAITLVDKNDRFVSWNRYTEIMLGASRDDLYQKPIDSFFYSPKPWGAMRTRLLQQIGKIDNFEAVLMKKDGSRVDVAISVSALKDAKGEIVGTIAVTRDISESKRALAELKSTQRMLIQSEKLASIGELAAGIAHEINNPAGFIGSNIDTLSDYIADITKIFRVMETLSAAVQEGDLEKAQSIEKEITKLEEEMNLSYIFHDMDDLLKESKVGIARIANIMRDLKTFSHMQEDVFIPSRLCKVVDSVLNIVRSEIKYKAELKKDYVDDPLITCNPQQIGQVLINVLVNAAQAIESNGVISIKTCAREGFAYIEISDTGCGIPKENMNKIFDPFFTTKEPGKGTGLGLGISATIIKRHGGTIKVESEIDLGTTVIISLPLSKTPGKTDSPRVG